MTYFTQKDLETAEALLAIDRQNLLARYTDAEAPVVRTGIVVFADMIFGLFGKATPDKAYRRFIESHASQICASEAVRDALNSSEPGGEARAVCLVRDIAVGGGGEAPARAMVLAAVAVKDGLHDLCHWEASTA